MYFIYIYLYIACKCVYNGCNFYITNYQDKQNIHLRSTKTSFHITYKGHPKGEFLKYLD